MRIQFKSAQKALWVYISLNVLFAPAFPVFGGTDDASRYTPGNTGTSVWMGNAHRGDIEFGIWEHESEGNLGFAGRFIGDSTSGAGDINTDGKSFGIYANPNTAPFPSAASTRKFALPALTTGDTLSFKLSVNNRSPGSRGFDLRNSSRNSVFNFDVRSGGYYVNGDNGASLNPSHNANTVFTFTFTQRERIVEYSIQRSGGISASTSGSFSADSGTIADVRFYIVGTGPGDASNLYFNQFDLSKESRGDSPLTIGERRLLGRNPSYLLRFTDPIATSVTMRHSGDGFVESYPLAKGLDGVWSVDIRSISNSLGGPPLQAGWHEFKFRLDGVYESGSNRRLYLDSQGRISSPPAVYLTWQRDPSTTMTVSWYNHDLAQSQVGYRLAGQDSWNYLTSTTQPFPHTERHIHTSEITGLSPDTIYEFQVDGYDETFKFRTMPSSLVRPVKIGVGGDVDVGVIADSMTSAIASKDPDFLIVGGDHAYEDARASNSWRWYRYMESWYKNARAPDGRMIPLVVSIGNHEVYNGFVFNHPDFEDTSEWRNRYASYYYRTFPFPGAARAYAALDFGNYLSLILTDTEHSSPVITGNDAQTQWIAASLEARRSVSHIFPIHHVPAYTTYRSFNDVISTRIRQHWVPLYENAGVKTVFEHHDHTFKRTKPLLGGVENPSGIRYVGDGLWGIGKRTPDPSRPYLEITTDQHHVHLVTLTSTNRTVEAVGLDGNFFGGRMEQSIDGPPPSPSSSVGNMTPSSITLSWDKIDTATLYKITRNDGQEIEVESTFYTDNDWSPSSGYSYSVTAINRSGSSENQIPSSPSNRQIWNLQNSLPWDGAGDGSNESDPDGDGLPNIQEYLHGTNPQTPENTRPFKMSVIEGGAVSLFYKKNPTASDVNVEIWRSSDLSEGDWRKETGTHTPLSGESQGWMLFQPPVVENESSAFFKLKFQ